MLRSSCVGRFYCFFIFIIRLAVDFIVSAFFYKNECFFDDFLIVRVEMTVCGRIVR